MQQAISGRPIKTKMCFWDHPWLSFSRIAIQCMYIANYVAFFIVNGGVRHSLWILIANLQRTFRKWCICFYLTVDVQMFIFLH